MSSSYLTRPSTEPGNGPGVDTLHAETLLRLLYNARSQVGRNSDIAQTLIGRAFALLKAEIDNSHIRNANGISYGGLAPWQIRRVCQYVEEHIDQPIRLEHLSVVVHLSTTHFSRTFKRTMGETPHSFVIRCRLEQARHLMLTTELSLSNVALACGFADQAHFTRTFHQSIKMSPGAWRRRARFNQPESPIRRGKIGDGAAYRRGVAEPILTATNF